MNTLPAYALATVVLYACETMIFYILLLIERRVWPLASNRGTEVVEGDVRFVHRVLKHMVPVLPPSNGVVVAGGLVFLVWQAIDRHGDWRSLVVLAWYLALQLYIIVFGKIAQAVKDVRVHPTDGDLGQVSRDVGALIRQHRNGLVHALGVLALEISLIVAPYMQGA